MPILENGATRTKLLVGMSFGHWTLIKIEYNHPGAQFGTHLFTFSNVENILHISNLYWSGDQMPCMQNGWWVPCPVELKCFGDRHSRVIYEIAKISSPLVG